MGMGKGFGGGGNGKGEDGIEGESKGRGKYGLKRGIEGNGPHTPSHTENDSQITYTRTYKPQQQTQQTNKHSTIISIPLIDPKEQISRQQVGNQASRKVTGETEYVNRLANGMIRVRAQDTQDAKK